MKEIRENFELKQREIADILKVDRSTYAGWEIGKDTIPLRKLNDFCNYFDVSIDYIVGISSQKKYNIINKEIDLQTVGKNLKLIRLNNNLKQKDIFNLLNTTSSTYSVYETCKVLIQTSFIYQIAKKYNCSIDWILGKTK